MKKQKKIVISSKIDEVISYLAYSFSSKVLERDDIKQDLYLLYVKTLRKNPKASKNQAGWFYMKFKWYLLTKYRKEVKRICREWDYGLENSSEKSTIQSRIGYLSSSRPNKKK